jgi:ADP-ribosylglycohydrolase
VKLPPKSAVTEIAAFGRSPDYHDPWPGISPFVIPSVLWSLYAFLHSPDDYWRAVTIAIEVGGDVDTTAAMTGALSGARLGRSAIPGWLARRVNDDGSWGHDELVALAHQAHDL